MKNFLNQVWVKVMAWCFIVLGCVVLILGGTGAAEIAKVPALVAGIVSAIGILIAFIQSMIKPKD